MDTLEDRVEQAFREGYLQGQKENAELKRMLRLAVEDIETAMNEEKCIVCGNNYCNGETICKWRYADEVEKLLEEKE